MPLDVLKYTVDALKGTELEPWVNALLFLVLLAAVVAVTKLLLGKKLIRVIFIILKKSGEKLQESTKYSPEFERFRKKYWPYVNLVGSIYMAFIGLFSGLVVLLAYYNTEKELAWNIHFLAWVWIIGSFLYMRVNLAQASWAFLELRNKDD
jgi:hypothetical protein